MAAAGRIGGVSETIPFICECADERCTDVLAIELVDYRAVRQNPRRFLHAPGHEHDGAGVVVEMQPGYAVVEKTDVAGDVAEELA